MLSHGSVKGQPFFRSFAFGPAERSVVENRIGHLRGLRPAGARDLFTVIGFLVTGRLSPTW